MGSALPFTPFDPFDRFDQFDAADAGAAADAFFDFLTRFLCLTGGTPYELCADDACASGCVADAGAAANAGAAARQAKAIRGVSQRFIAKSPGG